MRKLLLISIIATLAACTAEPGSERWCEQKKEQSKSEWSTSDAVEYARSCVIKGLAIGSEAWCKRVADKPKGDWSTNEATSYAKHCLI